jgi:hypothetical protein
LPFADPSLLSKLWQYRQAKSNRQSIVDGVGGESSATNTSFDFLQRLFSSKLAKKADVIESAMSKRIALNAIANHVGVDLTLTKEDTQIEPIAFPLGAWFRSSQSKLGQLLAETLQDDGAFSGLPIKQPEIALLLDAHMQGDDHTKLLFALLTLALWHRQVLA